MKIWECKDLINTSTVRDKLWVCLFNIIIITELKVKKRGYSWEDSINLLQQIYLLFESWVACKKRESAWVVLSQLPMLDESTIAHSQHEENVIC